jgi:hypothetical protein
LLKNDISVDPGDLGFQPIVPLLNNYLLPDLKLDVGVDFSLRPAAMCSDRFIDDDVFDLELKIS